MDPNSALPEGWKELTDAKTGKIYYYNKATKETSWKKPQHAAGGTTTTPHQPEEAVQKELLAVGGENEEVKEVKFAVANTAASHAPTAEPPTATESNDLPEGWKEMTDPKTGKIYYFNKTTKDTSWKKPTATSTAAPSSSSAPTAAAVVTKPTAVEAKASFADKKEATPSAASNSGTPSTSTVSPAATDKQTVAERGGGVGGGTIIKQSAFGPIKVRVGEDAAKGKNETKEPSSAGAEGEDKKNAEVNKASGPSTVVVADSATSSDLPEGWKEMTDPKTGKIYYYNKTTKDTSWKKPTATASAAVAKPQPASTSEVSAVATPLSAAAASPKATSAPSADDGGKAAPSPNGTGGGGGGLSIKDRIKMMEKGGGGSDTTATATASSSPTVVKPTPSRSSAASPAPAADVAGNNNSADAEWTEYVDPTTDKSYFVHKRTSERVWKLPAGATATKKQQGSSSSAKSSPAPPARGSADATTAKSNNNNTTAPSASSPLSTSPSNMKRTNSEMKRMEADADEKMRQIKEMAQTTSTLTGKNVVKNNNAPAANKATLNSNNLNSEKTTPPSIMALLERRDSGNALGTSSGGFVGRTNSNGALHNNISTMVPAPLNKDEAKELRKSKKVTMASMGADGENQAGAGGHRDSSGGMSGSALLRHGHLPKYWVAATDLDTGKIYYLHQVTRRRLTTKPTAQIVQEEDTRTREILFFENQVKREMEAAGRRREAVFMGKRSQNAQSELRKTIPISVLNAHLAAADNRGGGSSSSPSSLRTQDIHEVHADELLDGPRQQSATALQQQQQTPAGFEENDENKKDNAANVLFQNANHHTFWVIKHEPRINCYYYENALTGRIKWIRREDVETAVVINAAALHRQQQQLEMQQQRLAAAQAAKLRILGQKPDGTPLEEGLDDGFDDEGNFDLEKFETTSVVSDATTTNTEGNFYRGGGGSSNNLLSLRGPSHASASSSMTNVTGGFAQHDDDVDSTLARAREEQQGPMHLGNNKGKQQQQAASSPTVSGHSILNSGAMQMELAPTQDTIYVFGGVRHATSAAARRNNTTASSPPQRSASQSNANQPSNLYLLQAMGLGGGGGGMEGSSHVGVTASNASSSTTASASGQQQTTAPSVLMFEGNKWRAVVPDALLQPPIMGDFDEIVSCRIPATDECLLLGTVHVAAHLQHQLHKYSSNKSGGDNPHSNSTSKHTTPYQGFHQDPYYNNSHYIINNLDHHQPHAAYLSSTVSVPSAFIFNPKKKTCYARPELGPLFSQGAAFAGVPRGILITGGQEQSSSTTATNFGGPSSSSASSPPRSGGIQSLLPASHRDIASEILIDNEWSRPKREATVVDIYTLSTHKLPPMSLPRSNHTMVVLDASNAYRLLWVAYAIGGFDGKRKSAAVERYVLGGGYWELMKPMNVARSSAASCIVERTVFVFGGRSGYAVTNTCEKMHTQTDEWVMMPPMKQARCAFTATVVKPFIVVVGGWDGTRWLNACEAFDAKIEQWRVLVNLPSPRSSYGMCLLPQISADMLMSATAAGTTLASQQQQPQHQQQQNNNNNSYGNPNLTNFVNASPNQNYQQQQQQLQLQGGGYNRGSGGLPAMMMGYNTGGGDGLRDFGSFNMNGGTRVGGSPTTMMSGGNQSYMF